MANRKRIVRGVAICVLVLAVSIVAGGGMSGALGPGGASGIGSPIAAGTDLTGIDSLRLHRAAAQGRSALVYSLLRAAVDPNLISDSWLRRTPLHFAVDAPVGVVGLIIAMLALAGADPNRRDSGGRTPLILASMNGRDAAAHALILMGADANIASLTSKTPLLEAVLKGNVALGYELIGAGADVNAADASGKTPLHYAALRRDLVLVKLLIDAGADVNAADTSGKTPLDVTDASQYEIIRLLTSKGAYVAPERALRGRVFEY